MDFDLFQLGRALHASAGLLALVTFWIAALSVKGSALHKRAGRIYLCALLAVMAMSTLMVTGKALLGEIGQAVYFVFLISMVATASWLMWFAIRDRQDRQRLIGRTYRGLASWLVLSGSIVLGIGIAQARPLTIFLSLLGIGFGANMWRLALMRGNDARWWLQQHMNGAMLNFIATHDSFLALGIGSLLPEIREPVPRMLVAVTVVVAAVALRVWLGRRHLRPSSRIGHVSRMQHSP